jgi:hypothetical protein
LVGLYRKRLPCRRREGSKLEKSRSINICRCSHLLTTQKDATIQNHFSGGLSPSKILIITPKFTSRVQFTFAFTLYNKTLQQNSTTKLYNKMEVLAGPILDCHEKLILRNGFWCTIKQRWKSQRCTPRRWFKETSETHTNVGWIQRKLDTNKPNYHVILDRYCVESGIR